MYKNKGIEFFPPVKSFDEAYNVFKECGGVIISLEEDGFLVDEVKKICKLYEIPINQIELYFRDCLQNNGLSDSEIDEIITEWKVEEDIENLKL